MSGEPRIAAPVTHFAALLKVVRARIVELGITYDTVDEIAGFTPTYTSKILCIPPIKTMGVHTMFALLGAVALLPQIEHDGEHLEALQQSRHWIKRKYRHPMLTAVEHRPITIYLGTDFMRRIARKAVAARMVKLSPAKRSRIARNAAKARWSRPRIVEVKGEKAKKLLRDSTNRSASLNK